MSNFMGAGAQELPVGFIFEFDPTWLSNAPDLSTAAKVREYFGYGTWEAYGAGRVTIGVGSGYAVGSEGGEATHTLTIAEMPTHVHNVAKGSSSETSPFMADEYTAYQSEDAINPGRYWYSNVSGAGGSQPHNNLQPYRTVYRWRRIA